MEHKLYIGTSGWSYKHWRSTFYPEKLKVKDQFSYYAAHFDTVEINSTFYRLPTKETVLKWKNEVPDNFLYVVKASRYITHMKKLNNTREDIIEFMDRTGDLGEKLGAVLFQLPPSLKADCLRLDTFIKQLPDGFRYVFEFRNTDWYREEVYAILRNHDCAFCIYELAGHQSPMQVTADFVYVRLHGPGNKYQGSYPDDVLMEWAATCRQWLTEKDVFVYFDNDEKGYAAFNAEKLKALTSTQKSV